MLCRVVVAAVDEDQVISFSLNLYTLLIFDSLIIIIIIIHRHNQNLIMKFYFSALVLSLMATMGSAVTEAQAKKVR